MTLLSRGVLFVVEMEHCLCDGPNPSWAVAELGSAHLGDARRTARLVAIAAAVAEQPTGSLPQACLTWAATKGAYRFFGNESVDSEKILAAHRMATVERIGGYSTVLAVQDTTDFSFSHHPATKGLGPLGNTGMVGFFVHSCLALSPDGVPLGLLGQYRWVRSFEELGIKHKRRQRALEEKESYRWPAMLEDSTRGIPSTTRVVTVADREADIIDFFLAAIRLKQDVLVRAAWNRRLQHPDNYLWDAAGQAPVVGHLEIEVPRSDDQPSRKTTLELRATTVGVLAPQHRRLERLPVAPLTVVWARELTPPEGKEAISWLLLTTLSVQSQKEAAMCVRWYAHRWKIERYHYTLKSGCRLEELHLEAADRLDRALAVYAVVAWRLLSMTYAARVTPDQPCSAVLSQTEWQALYCTIHRTPTPPLSPPDLQTAIIWIARLGGFLARRGDGTPGVKVLWRGYRRLQDLTEMWSIVHPDTCG